MKNAAPASTSLKLSTPVSMSNKAKAPWRHEHLIFYGPKQPPGSSRARRMRANYCNCLMFTLRAHRGNKHSTAKRDMLECSSSHLSCDNLCHNHHSEADAGQPPDPHLRLSKDLICGPCFILHSSRS